jgi:predicted transcriptional regulator
VKSMTLRLDDGQARELAAVARADNIPISEFIREAISSQIEARRQNDEFRARLRGVMDEDREILERLAQ